MTRYAVIITTLAVACAPAQRIPNIGEVPVEQRLVATPDQFELGPGDSVAIRVWRHDDLDMEVTIAPDGSITYPLVGRIQVSGMTYPELVDVLAGAISEYYEDPQVSVNIVSLENQEIFVLGEVASPQVLQLNNATSMLEALTRAGGINTSARTDNVLLIRGGLEEPELYTVDVKSIYMQGEVGQRVYLQRGDIVFVPTRTITNMSRYFREVQGILSPFVAGSAVYRNAVSGGAQGTSSALE